MQPHKVLDIVLKTADQLSAEYPDYWEGDVFDFVSASVIISDRLSSRSVEDLHNEMNGASFVTSDCEIFFYGYGRNRKIYVKPLDNGDENGKENDKIQNR